MKENDSLRKIKGIGEKSEKLFAKLGITSVGELLRFYPREYEIFTPIQPVSSLREGDTVIIEGCFTGKPRMTRVRNLKIISGEFKDSTGMIPVRWFNMPYLMKSLMVGRYYILRGKVTQKNGMLQLTQPKILTKEEYANSLGKLKPVYPLTSGLTNNAVTKAVTHALEAYEYESDFLPVEIRKRYHLLSLKKAMKEIHFPLDKQSYMEARRRLTFDEFFLFSLALHHMKRQKHKKKSSYPLCPGEKTEKLFEMLPFSLTSGQKSAWQQIQEDIGSGCVMNRLIQGDVGSGKTVIALLSLLAAVESGHQGAIMVPTEVLAKQHYEEFCRYLEPLGVCVGLLTGSMTAAKKRNMREKIAAHRIDIVVGTQALIQEGVVYDDLALIVTDEQHRFGVKQRELFSDKGQEPHILVMSATPIPRTLAIILYGDLDVSVIDVLPTVRLPIKNCAVGTNYRPQAYRFLEKEVASGHQVYIICPMVEESESIEAENVLDYTENLQKTLSSEVRIRYLHGKMKPAEKNQIMEEFAAHEIDVLVSTTVIEVGINVPNATVVMIENAERFGLAQLHQLRGRVGRGKAQSYCIFMAGNTSEETMERLRVVEGSNDGFYVAQKDLELRGPGDMFGVRQSGELYFRLGDIYQDARELQEANEAAGVIEEKDMLLLCKKHQVLREKMESLTGEVFL